MMRSDAGNGKALILRMEAFTPEGFEKMMADHAQGHDGNDVWQRAERGGLDAQDTLLLTLAGLTMQGAQNETPCDRPCAMRRGRRDEQDDRETIGRCRFLPACLP